MRTTTIEPVTLPATRILGDDHRARRQLLALVDVVVGYVAARHRHALLGWHVEAALVEARSGFRGGDTVALRVRPDGSRPFAELAPVPLGALREMGSRLVDAVDGIANVVPDIASSAPDVDGRHLVLAAPRHVPDARTA